LSFETPDQLLKQIILVLHLLQLTLKVIYLLVVLLHGVVSLYLLTQLLKLELVQSGLLPSLIQLLLHAKQLSLKVGLILLGSDDFLSLFLGDDKLVI
jgi:hypothetical protein